jgi:DNA adenine methylase
MTTVNFPLSDLRAYFPAEQETIKTVNVYPFVKWAGGKGQLLPELDKLIPRQFNRYFEPFLGGGAFFFHMMSRARFNACLSDTNAELITTYKTIRDNVNDVIQLLQTYETEYKKYPPYSKEQQKYYFQLRDVRNNIKSSNAVEIAALFNMLNKTCFNGLYRVNGKGEFNVPPGKYKNPLICDPDSL